MAITLSFVGDEMDMDNKTENSDIYLILHAWVRASANDNLGLR
jgi:hypothetical protein